MPEKRAASSLAPIANTLRPNGVACSRMPNATARIANSTIVFGIAVPVTRPNAVSVQYCGKSVTELSPITTYASPRNSASVPIVTASDGSPRRVTSKPLNAPQSAPTAMQTGAMNSIGRPAFQRSAMTALDSASTDATDRSISAATITSVSASAISATSVRSSDPVVNESPVRKRSDSALPIASVITTSPAIRTSQRPSSSRTVGPLDGRATAASADTA